MMRRDPSKPVPAHAISYDDNNAFLTTPASAPSFKCTALTCAPRCSASSSAISTILIAIESSCMLFPILECSQRGLPQAYAAIVGRHRTVGPDPKALLACQRFNIVQQQLILKDAAREYDGIHRIGLAQHHHRVAKTLSKPALKRPCANRRFSSPPPVLRQRREQGTEIQFFPAQWKRIGFGVGHSTRQLFHPHGGLTFKRYFPRKAQQSGRR